MISAIAMTVMLVVALGCFSWLIIPRLKLVLRAPGEARIDNPVERTKNVLKFAIGQWRMPREPIAGFAHIFIFSGFMVVALGTILHIVHAYAPKAVDAFYLETTVGKCYAFIKDVFEYLVLLGVSYGLWRRLKPKVSRVGRSAEGVFVRAEHRRDRRAGPRPRRPADREPHWPGRLLLATGQQARRQRRR